MTVTSAAELSKAVSSAGPATVLVQGMIAVKGQVAVGSDKSVVGVGPSSGLTGGGLRVKGSKNVVLANLNIAKAEGTDAITVEGSTNVLVTRNDLSSDLDHGKDFYDGLLDITHGSDNVTVSFNRFHDHAKVMLIGHSDENAGEDRGKLRVTVHHNSFVNVGSRLPSLRFGTGHVFNNVMQKVSTSAISSRMGASVLVQNNVLTDVTKPLQTDQSGTPGTILDNPATPPALPYQITVEPTGSVAASVAAGAGPR